MNNPISSNAIYTSDYIIEHILSLPDGSLDYDYSKNERYPLTYIHTINLYDGIMNQLQYSISFSSEICAEIISRLYEVMLSSDLYDLFNHEDPIQIDSIAKSLVLYIYYDTNTTVQSNSIFSSLDPNIIIDCFDDSGFNTKIRFRKSEIEKILELLASDPIMEDLFVSYL